METDCNQLISFCCEYEIQLTCGGYLDSTHGSNLFNQLDKMIFSETFILFEYYYVLIHSLN